MNPIKAIFRAQLVLVCALLLLPLRTSAERKSLHPPLLLLDKDGNKVITSNRPISTRRSCGTCHDYDYISRGFHFQQGRKEFSDTNKNLPQPFYSSPGMFGKYCSMPNRTVPHLNVDRAEDFDIGAPEWVKSCGVCHPGGGIAEYDNLGRRLDSVDPNSVSKFNIYYNWYDPLQNKLVKWDWRESGVEEIDCFLCHTDQVNRKKRDEYIREGYFDEVSNATLVGSGIVKEDEESGELIYLKNAFDSNGYLKPGRLELKKPGVNNCAECHGFAAVDKKAAKIDPFYGSHDVKRGTKKMGRIWSSAKISESNVNLVNKEKYDYPWDIHAAKGLSCIDCHFSLNNPTRISKYKKPKHLKFQPLNIDYSEYLKKPNHNFAKGHNLPETVREDLDFTMRGCTDCHDPLAGQHNWLPYAKHHFQRLSCQTCHIPRKNFWAYQQVDISFSNKSVATVRGASGNYHDPNVKISGFLPAYLSSKDKHGIEKIVPANPISALIWSDAAKDHRPIFQRDLIKVFFNRNSNYQLEYKPSVIKIFDKNKDGKLDKSELKLDTKEKATKIKALFKKIGIEKAELILDLVPFTLGHNIVSKNALRECKECHYPNNRLQRDYEIFSYVPAEYLVECISCSDHQLEKLVAPANNTIVWRNASALENFYLIGASHNNYIEVFGWFSVIATLLLSVVHGILRIISSQRRRKIGEG